MKLKLEFTAEIVEDIGDVQSDRVLTAEQNKAIIEELLREYCGAGAEVAVRECRLIHIA